MKDTLRTLDEVARDIRRSDSQLFLMIAQRMALAKEVGKIKKETKKSIVRLEVEEGRLKSAHQYAKEHGVNPHFAEAILYFIIAESCKEQTMLMEAKDGTEVELTPELLKGNLIRLTQKVAAQYDEYGKHSYGTKAVLEYEAKLLERIMAARGDMGWNSAIDIGCATGRMSFLMAKQYQEVTGYDISPTMISVAKSKLERADGELRRRVRFKQHDVEKGIYSNPNSVSLTVMSFGTAGDIIRIEDTLNYIYQALKPGGTLIASFYNKASLCNNLGFLPWRPSLSAICAHGHLDVTWNEEIFTLPAKLYTVDEAKTLLTTAGFTGIEVSTYPTLGSILPDSILLEDPKIDGMIEMIDTTLASEVRGYYIIVKAEKPMGS